MIQNDSLRAGQHLGRYELIRPIGRGGMATVWAARLAGTRGFQKLVAVKAMLPDLRTEPEAEQMFMREATIASRIRHPNVVEIFDVGDEKGVLYIVMEWVHGEALGAIVTTAAKQRGIPMGVATRIGIQMCEGLHAAHELRDENGEPTGLVHRDISPHNILVGFNGTVKVADFGIAKVQSEGWHTTQVGQLKGKLGYMAPEQIRYAPIDRRTDVFAAAIVLYVATTGRHPFRKQEQHETVHALCFEDPVRPSTFHANYPKRLEEAILKALSKDPASRQATAQELANDLARSMPPAAEHGNLSAVQHYVRALMPERLERHQELVRSAFGDTNQLARPASSSSNTTLRAVAVSSEGDAPNEPHYEGPHANTRPALRRTRTPGRRVAAAAASIAVAGVLGAIGVVQLSPSAASHERENEKSKAVSASLRYQDEPRALRLKQAPVEPRPVDEPKAAPSHELGASGSTAQVEKPAASTAPSPKTAPQPRAIASPPKSFRQKSTVNAEVDLKDPYSQ